MTNRMCDGCSIQKNKEQWAKYPDMMDLCKLCKSFQSAIEQTIDDFQKTLDQAAKIAKKLEAKGS